MSDTTGTTCCPACKVVLQYEYFIIVNAKKSCACVKVCVFVVCSSISSAVLQYSSLLLYAHIHVWLHMQILCMCFLFLLGKRAFGIGAGSALQNTFCFLLFYACNYSMLGPDLHLITHDTERGADPEALLELRQQLQMFIHLWLHGLNNQSIHH